jgi:hypothetical protein
VPVCPLCFAGRSEEWGTLQYLPLHPVMVDCCINLLLELMLSLSTVSVNVILVVGLKQQVCLMPCCSLCEDRCAIRNDKFRRCCCQWHGASCRRLLMAWCVIWRLLNHVNDPAETMLWLGGAVDALGRRGDAALTCVDCSCHQQKKWMNLSSTFRAFECECKCLDSIWINNGLPYCACFCHSPAT